MNISQEIDLEQLCRICANIANDGSANALVKNNEITTLGEICISCLGIQLLIDGYPQRVCDYCRLQLNTFNAFVKKAQATSCHFDSILEEHKVLANELNKMNDTEKLVENDTCVASETSEIDFEEQDRVSLQELNIESNVPLDIYDCVTETIEMKVYENTATEELSNSATALAYASEDEGEYTVEYLEPEYITTFVDEITKNDDVTTKKEPISKDTTPPKTTKKLIAKKVTTSEKGRGKRTYPYRCKKCMKRFVYKEVYEAHVRIHKGLPGFSCPHCPKTFNEKANFDYHMQDHTNYRPAKCDLCEKSFKNKQDLASHLRCHNDVRKYMCDVCGKRFRSQSHMVYHRYAHFEARNFHCDQCEQKFKSPHILRTHKNTVHSTVYRYECKVCGRKFKRDHHLVAHMRTHNKEPGRKTRQQKRKGQTIEIIDITPSNLKHEEEIDIEFADDPFEEEDEVEEEVYITAN